MLDTATLRVAFGVVGFCVVVLFWGVTYRTTRSSYARWWCVSLTLFLVSALLFLLNGTAAQVVANPLGNTLAVAGASGVWAAARSLRGGAVPLWQLGLPPGLVMVASFLDDPAHDIWTGGPYFLSGMAIALGLSSYELTVLLRGPAPSGARAQFRFAVSSLASASALVSLFYALRAVVFVAVGPDDPLFRNVFGSPPTTLLTMVLLVVVTFSMSELSHQQQTSELRELATHDGLTGLLNRSEFLNRADDVFATSGRHGAAGVIMVADLDGFKALNDSLGHAAGDRALIEFAAACRAVADGSGLVGRLGGDEFALLLPDGSRAEEIADTISQLFSASGSADQQVAPTISFGIASIDPAVGVKGTIVRADVALYQAKAAGRDRVFRYDDAAG